MVSVIVPVYNVEDYLPRCLDSIVSQTYKDLEIILVDDGSTDSSGNICDDYVKKDSRIRVIHQKNGGLPSARNVGLKNAKGDSVLFVDCDDAINPQMIEILWTLLNKGDYDFSMCYGEQIYDTDSLKDKMTHTPKISNFEELSRYSCMKELYIGNRITENQYKWVWNKLYKKHILENLYFYDTAAEDVEYNNRVYLRINKAVLVKEYLYYWIQRNGSISHQGYKEWYVNVLKSYLLCLTEIPYDNSIFRSYCLRRLYRLMLSKRYWARMSAFRNVAENNCKSILKQTSSELMRNPYIPFVERIVLLVFNYCPFLYRVYIKVVNII